VTTSPDDELGRRLPLVATLALALALRVVAEVVLGDLHLEVDAAVGVILGVVALPVQQVAPAVRACERAPLPV
jgi:hypothetical protein